MRTLLAAVIVLCCALPAAAGTMEELTPYFSTQYFTWQERINGRRLLKEEGALFSVGARVGAVIDSSFTLRGKGELFGSEVGYRGETQAPDSTPVHTRVTYLGTNAEVDLGYRLHPANIVLEPFGGIGYRYWLRDLQDSTTSDGTRVTGYTEAWNLGYCRLGARSVASAGGVKFTAGGGAKYPFYVGNTVDFEGSGDTTFHPKGRWSGFAEAGVSYRSLTVALLYEGFRFRRSDPKMVQGTAYFQPDSSSDIFGVRVGWAF
ncbi:hypothetical protein KOM00_02545 [Geomonas sp. Red69]|uniref:Outer membrane protein beta-barrel domain-containing protein n=1 Tax=Geomonas diazotrophica TaxID=2843197 RepID=A0ABX8JLE1_9BACT|nr:MULTISPECIES: hypothetical protein [Geomonas]MBU5635604.1 hypothetical protein [Geomonas diazotrophica]QWV98152.1 hypothetical protein KP005_02335 [Geomonas nitrogeniifigens]QXE87283.1 hypothetical protein KP003_02435 [Geomonas nitrogeniifigens]